MDCYNSFARVYDELMDNIPYREWAHYILGLLKEYGIENGLVAELGCGTGNITELLSDAGYDMIGIDNSEDMLEVANEKKQLHGNDSILYLLQDMEEFELFGTVNAIICVCDSINYVTDKAGITEVFRLANNYLEAGSIFICDFKTRHYFRDVVGESVIAEDRDDISFIWDNYYDEEQDINELALSLFVREDVLKRTPAGEEKSEKGGGSDDYTGADGGTIYRKYQEYHYQIGLDIEEMKKCVEESGMELVAMYDAFTHEPATHDSERVYVIARETKQSNKFYC